MKEFAHLRLADEKWRKQANRKIVRAIDEQSELERFGDKRTAFDRQFNAKHASFTADFLDEIESGFEFFEPRANFLSALADIFQKFLVFDDSQEFESYGEDHRTPAESSAVKSGRDARCHGITGQDRAQRESGGQRLGDDGDVRLGRKSL